MVVLNALHSVNRPEILQIPKILGCDSPWELSQRQGCLCAERCTQDPCFNELTAVYTSCPESGMSRAAFPRDCVWQGSSIGATPAVPSQCLTSGFLSLCPAHVSKGKDDVGSAKIGS